ncbi:MAG: hypothetical protein ACK4QL_09510 [Pseudanabaenaceae cyanobacterium]
MTTTPTKPTVLPEPLWLKGLIATQQVSITTAVLLTASLLAVYGWSVHTQAQWNQQYQKLQLLKRQERKLAGAIETFENDLVANLNRYTNGLIKEDRSQSIYLEIPSQSLPQPVSAPLSPPPTLPSIRAY